MFRYSQRSLLNCIFVLWPACSAGIAQSIPQLNDNQKAVVSFDLRLDKMMASGEAAGAETSAVAEIPMQGKIFEGINVSDLKRIFGATSLPGGVDQITQMGPESELPLEFFVRFQFANSEVCSRLKSNLENAQGTRTKEFGGKTFFQPPAGETPDNIVAHQIDDTTFEFGTINYCVQPDRTFFSDELKATWQQVPNDALRIAADLGSRADLIQEAIEMGKQGLPPQAGPFLDLVDNMSSLIISADLEQPNLLTLVLSGVDEAQAEELRSGVDSLLGLAKMGASMQTRQMSQQMPEIGEVVSEIMESLVAKREGTTVKVIVPRPEGFFEAMNKLQTLGPEQPNQISKDNRFRQAALAFHNYAAAYRNFPFDVEGREGQNNRLSWRVRVLPFIEQLQMYEQMDLSAGPENEKNAAFADKMPGIFGDGGKLSDISWVKPPRPVKGFANIPDGTSNTIMLLENPKGQKWLENNSLSVDEAVSLIKGLEDGQTLVAVLYDGSVRQINNSIKEETLRNLFDPADGNVIEDFE